MKEWTIAHSAKGSSWTKHKYISKSNGKYVYPKKSGSNKALNKLRSAYNYKNNMTYYSPNTKTPVTVNAFGDNREFYKIGGKYYHMDDINAASERMDAANKYNNTMKNAGLRTGLKAKSEYEKSVKAANDFQKNSKDSNNTFNKITLGVLNSKEKVKEAAKKGKKLISKLFGR